MNTDSGAFCHTRLPGRKIQDDDADILMA